MRANDLVIEQFIKGDIEAMSVLIETYKNDLFNLCFRLTFNTHDAEDLFQQTWVKAVGSAPRYQNKAFKAWLFRICVNQYKDNYRKYIRRKNHLKDDFETTSAKDYVLTAAKGKETVEEQFEKMHIRGLLISKIDKLPEQQKIPVILFYYQQMKYSEIAGIMCVPEGTVKSRINAAKKKLKSVLESELYV